MSSSIERLALNQRFCAYILICHGPFWMGFCTLSQLGILYSSVTAILFWKLGKHTTLLPKTCSSMEALNSSCWQVKTIIGVKHTTVCKHQRGRPSSPQTTSFSYRHSNQWSFVTRSSHKHPTSGDFVSIFFVYVFISITLREHTHWHAHTHARTHTARMRARAHTHTP